MPRANADKPRKSVPPSGGRRPERAETLANGPPGPGAPTPQEDDPGRCEAQLDSRCSSSVSASTGRCRSLGRTRCPDLLARAPLRRRSSLAGHAASKSCRGGRWRCASGTIAPKKGSSPGRWRSTRRFLLHPATDVVKPAHGDVQEPKGPLVVHVDVLHVTDEAGPGVEDPPLAEFVLGGTRVLGELKPG